MAPGAVRRRGNRRPTWGVGARDELRYRELFIGWLTIPVTSYRTILSGIGEPDAVLRWNCLKFRAVDGWHLPCTLRSP